MDAAYKDMVKNNPNLIDEYVQMVSGMCDQAGNMAQLCKQVAGPALKKYLESIDKEDATKYCTTITMCSNARRAFWSLEDDTGTGSNSTKIEILTKKNRGNWYIAKKNIGQNIENF